MASTTDPKEPKRPRGRPEKRLVIDPAKAGAGLDRLLGKRQAKPEEPPATDAPRVRSKRPKGR